MSPGEGFVGFPEEGLAFFEQLAANNDKLWFDKHRPDYDRFVLEPSRAFVEALGLKLEPIAPQVVADPRVNRSLFRIHRDTRFSKDKTPYKTNFGVWLWEGEGKRMACSGFYVHVEPTRLMLGVGRYRLDKDELKAFREAVADDTLGPELEQTIAEVQGAGDYTIGMAHYKRVPRGYDKDHPRAELLKYNGLTAGIDLVPPPEVLHSAEFVGFCVEHFKKMVPIHRWIQQMLATM